MPCSGCAERRETIRQVGRVVVQRAVSTGRTLREEAERLARAAAQKARR